MSKLDKLNSFSKWWIMDRDTYQVPYLWVNCVNCRYSHSFDPPRSLDNIPKACPSCGFKGGRKFLEPNEVKDLRVELGLEKAF
jgi:hypothetical protein